MLNTLSNTFSKLIQPLINATMANVNKGITADDSADDVSKQVQKVFRPIAKNSLIHMGVPDGPFTLAHVLAAAIVGHAVGTAGPTPKIQGLKKKGNFIRIGPDVFDFEDANRTCTRAQSVSLFTFDISTSKERLTVAGIAYILYGKKAIAKIISQGSSENLKKFLSQKDGKEQFATIFRRTYKRLIKPIDDFFVSDMPQSSGTQLATAESNLLYAALQANIDTVKAESLNAEEVLSSFMISLYLTMDFFAKFICSQLSI